VEASTSMLFETLIWLRFWKRRGWIKTDLKGCDDKFYEEGQDPKSKIRKKILSRREERNHSLVYYRGSWCQTNFEKFFCF